MTATLYALTCGRLVGRLKDMIEGEEGAVTLPVPSFLIEHPKGRVLFDTGIHPQCRTDAAGRLGERVARLFGFEGFGEGDDVAEEFLFLRGEDLILAEVELIGRGDGADGEDDDVVAAEVGFLQDLLQVEEAMGVTDGDQDAAGDHAHALTASHQEHGRDEYDRHESLGQRGQPEQEARDVIPALRNPGTVAAAERGRRFVGRAREPLAVRLHLLAAVHGRQRRRNPARLEGVGGVGARLRPRGGRQTHRCAKPGQSIPLFHHIILCYIVDTDLMPNDGGHIADTWKTAI